MKNKLAAFFELFAKAANVSSASVAGFFVMVALFAAFSFGVLLSKSEPGIETGEIVFVKPEIGWSPASTFVRLEDGEIVERDGILGKKGDKVCVKRTERKKSNESPQN